MSFQNFSTGNSHSFGGKYVEIKPNEFLKYTIRISLMILTYRVRS
ncbi:SRPBCC family protein [Chitinophaga niabensis]|nr:hypothetical protein [Chitinophaga niabensis]